MKPFSLKLQPSCVFLYLNSTIAPFFHGLLTLNLGSSASNTYSEPESVSTSEDSSSSLVVERAIVLFLLGFSATELWIVFLFPSTLSSLGSSTYFVLVIATLTAFGEVALTFCSFLFSPCCFTMSIYLVFLCWLEINFQSFSLFQSFKLHQISSG